MNPKSSPAARASATLTRAVAALLTVAATASSSLAVADTDNYLPFVEPLQVTQKRAYYSAAPAGQDTPLAVPEAPVTLPLKVSIDSESRLESRARDRSGASRVEETSQGQDLKDALEQFGYDIFNRAPSTFAPVEGIPVPADYRIGPGDNIVVQLFGKRNVEYNLVVTRDGKILIPEFGPVAVGGLSFDDAEQLITTGFDQRMIGARAVVTMGKLRTIQIRLAGDVRQPGIYTIGGLSSLIDALLTTGGIAGTGTLRDIHLIRGGETVARLDLYELLLNGRSTADSFLRHNDTVFVPAIGDVVYVGGEVQRPAIYELRGETTLADVLAMAGGLLPTASLEDSIIERLHPGRGRAVIDFHRSGAAAVLETPIAAGDLLRILPLEDELDTAVMLQGRVERPGAYGFEAGMRLSTLLRSTDSLLAGADLEIALIEREDRASLRSRVLFASPRAALTLPGSEADPVLASRDRVRILSLDEPRGEALADLRETLERQASDPRAARAFELHGALRHTGRLPLAEGMRLLDAIALGGGLSVGADRHTGFIARTRLPNVELDLLPFSITAARADFAGAANPALRAGDRIYVLNSNATRSELLSAELTRLRKQARYGQAARIVSVLGEVQSPGSYPLTEGMRASDLLCAARGLSRRGDGVMLTLTRSSTETDNAQVDQHRVLDTEALLARCAAVQSPGREAASSEPSLDPLLEPLDRITVTQRPGWHDDALVTLSGEIVRPGVYALSPGETLCDVLSRAGGLTTAAYAFGAEFTRESVREVQQRTLDELQARLDDLMIELSLSHSVKNEEKASHEWAGKQDTLRVIRQLERAKATGRMVVDLDRVQRCRRRDALVLEDGDRLDVPRMPNHVQVAGQVYVPTSHLHSSDRSIRDYIELSGGHTVLGRIDHAYVIQANGEVQNLKAKRSSRKIARAKVMPGARIYVPINVDRMNPTEKAQSWVSTLAQAAILAGIVL